MRVSSFFFLLALCAGASEYRPVDATATLASFVFTVGPRGSISLEAAKKNGQTFAVHSSTNRYLLREGAGPVREYRHPISGAAVVPSIGGWDQLFPAAETDTVQLLGHTYRRVNDRDILVPSTAETVYLQPDLLIGQAHNTRQADETRRYDTSDYQYIKLTEADYRQMAEAGISCVNVDEQQAEWAHRLGLFYWGTANLPYPEMLYRPQYLGPALFLDEPAVGTRDHVLRPRLEKDPAFRIALTPALAFDAFREHFAESAKRNAATLIKTLRARKDIDIGAMDFPQANLYSWETMEATAAYELSQHPQVPRAFVWEPAGRVGTSRTIPEFNMNYGTRFPQSPHVLPIIINSFLRGAARATNKQWGISIYGAVERADAPYLLTRAYDDGATHFFFWSSYQLACVPFNEVLAHARHLRAHSLAHPRTQPAAKADLAILIPPGYNLGHVFMGKGLLWGLTELHRERSFGKVMTAAMQEMEKAMLAGTKFDVLWDLPNLPITGYRQVIRIDERTQPQPLREDGPPITLSVQKTSDNWYTAHAETPADVFYTTGAGPNGVYRNARFYWELYGPNEEDMRIIPPGETVRFQLSQPGAYRLRVAATDTQGRSTVVWKTINHR